MEARRGRRTLPERGRRGLARRLLPPLLAGD